MQTYARRLNMKKTKVIALTTAMCAMFAMTACGTANNQTAAPSDNANESAVAAETSVSANESEPEAVTDKIDYMALVNKLNPLPEGWEDALETKHMTNSVGDDVEVEAKAYDAYLALKDELEKEDIHVDLDSARRSVTAQQEIMDRFTKEYGADYAKKTVAEPGYSEHHTGLALDLYLIIDGKDVTANEDMIQYPEIWEKIHQKLAAHGFILRYLEDKEHITGYGYEPWHIRYIDNADVAKEITEKGITFEEYLGKAKGGDLKVDYGKSELYKEDELKEAAIQVKCNFASLDGCELKSLRYAGDECNTEENLKWLNSMEEGAEYVQVAEFLGDFYVSADSKTAFNPDQEYKDYQWWLARTKDGGWNIVSFGY